MCDQFFFFQNKLKLMFFSANTRDAHLFIMLHFYYGNSNLISSLILIHFLNNNTQERNEL